MEQKTSLVDDVPRSCELDALAAFLPSISDRSHFDHTVVQIATWLHAGLCARGQTRLDPAFDSKIRAPNLDALGELKSSLHAARGALAKLPKHARVDLNRKAFKRGTRLGLRAGQELNDAARILELLEACAASVETLYVGHRGRPSDPDVLLAVQSLSDLWEQETGSKATLTWDEYESVHTGPFLEFCERVIHPIYDLHTRKRPSVSVAIKKYRKQLLSSENP